MPILPDYKDIGQCGLCLQPMEEKDSRPTCCGILICKDCEKEFKRTRIPKPPKKPVK